MSIVERNRMPGAMGGWRGARGAIGAAMAVVCLFLLLPLPASTGASIREISLVTRDMAFYIEGNPSPNPTIRLGAGEEVRFVLRNLDPGIAHNLAIDGWDVETVSLVADASTSVRVRAPDRPGRQIYVCSPHREMMRGTIEIVAAGSLTS